MQLRVPKKYRRNSSGKPRRHRRLLPSRRWIFTWVFLIAIGYTGYWILQNPDEARVRTDNFRRNVNNTIEENRSDLFPEEPTPTPDVSNILIEGDRAYRQGDMETAIESYQQAIKGMPNDVNLHYKLAHTLVITSDFGADQSRIDEALKIADRTITANPESPLGWAVRAMALDWSGQYNLALAPIHRAQQLDPSSLLVRAHLINIYRNTGNTELALTVAEDVIEDAENRSASGEVIAQIYRNYGRLLLNAYTDPENAARAFERAYQAMPNHTYIAIDLAATYNQLGENDRAMSLMEEVSETNPRDVQILAALGNLYLFSGDSRYTGIFSRCVSIKPDYLDCASKLGQLYFWDGDYSAAIENLGNAVEAGSTDPYDYYALARSYWNQNRCNEAAPYFTQGYRLITEQGDTTQVGASDFVDAMNVCGLTIPTTEPD